MPAEANADETVEGEVQTEDNDEVTDDRATATSDESADTDALDPSSEAAEAGASSTTALTIIERPEFFLTLDETDIIVEYYFPQPIWHDLNLFDPQNPSWFSTETRVLILTMNYLNEALGLMLEMKLVIQLTDEGLYMADFSSNRHRLKFTENSTYYYLSSIMVLNVVLTIITFFNIEQERWEKTLMDEEKRRKEAEELKAQ